MRLFRINQTAPIMIAATIISARTTPTATPTEELSLPGGKGEESITSALLYQHKKANVVGSITRGANKILEIITYIFIHYSTTTYLNF